MVIFGLFLGGIGVVPIAFIALLLNGEWIALLELAIFIFIVFGFRSLGLYLGSKSGDATSNDYQEIAGD